MKIRLANFDDLERLVDLRLLHSFEICDDSRPAEHTLRAHNTEIVKNILSNDKHLTFVAEIDGEIASSAYISYTRSRSGHVGTLYGVYTKKDYRQQGITKQVLLMLIDDAKVRGIDRIELSSSLSDSEFYRSLGFVESDRPYVPPTLKFGGDNDHITN